jgi:hypothetical protein
VELIFNRRSLISKRSVIRQKARIGVEICSAFWDASHNKYFTKSSKSFTIDGICVCVGTGLRLICSIPGRGFYCNIRYIRIIIYG